jgi:hypothetical protein
MRTWDAETAESVERWADRELRLAIGAGPKTKSYGAYEPTGRHAWFAYTIAEVIAPLALRRLSEVWEVRPPYSDWRHYAPELRRRADEQMLAAKLSLDKSLAEWFSSNEASLQQDPSRQERIRIVADALLPIFDGEPEWGAAIGMLDDDFLRRTGSAANGVRLVLCTIGLAVGHK